MQQANLRSAFSIPKSTKFFLVNEENDIEFANQNGLLIYHQIVNIIESSVTETEEVPKYKYRET